MTLRDHTTAPHGRAHALPLWRSALAGLCSSLVGLGLARFAYTPLIPALVAARWFAPADVVYLGAANLAGYLMGALTARWLSGRIGAVPAIRWAMVAATLSCFAGATPLSFAWFFVWRLISGISGAVIMVLAASSILPQVSAARRGLLGGVIFAGVGLGIACSGTLVPLLLREGLAQCWIGLGILSGFLTLASWTSWPAASPSWPDGEAGDGPTRLSPLLRMLLVEYALNAFALVPHMVFLVDFVARGLGRGIDAGAQVWVVYGLGAILGPLLAGHLADRAGFGPALKLAYGIEAVAILLPALTSAPPALVVSSALAGAFTPGIVPLVLGRIHELVPQPGRQRRIWGWATTMFAVGQAVGAYGLSFLFQRVAGSYALLFEIGAAAVILALVLDLSAALTATADEPS